MRLWWSYTTIAEMDCPMCRKTSVMRSRKRWHYTETRIQFRMRRVKTAVCPECGYEDAWEYFDGYTLRGLHEHDPDYPLPCVLQPGESRTFGIPVDDLLISVSGTR
jgi:endogenous inhibitor of DNA gyrase (YacG/DUF329 family)